jgi:hypothetical protein
MRLQDVDPKRLFIVALTVSAESPFIDCGGDVFPHTADQLQSEDEGELVIARLIQPASTLRVEADTGQARGWAWR